MQYFRVHAGFKLRKGDVIEPVPMANHLGESHLLGMRCDELVGETYDNYFNSLLTTSDDPSLPANSRKTETS